MNGARGVGLAHAGFAEEEHAVVAGGGAGQLALDGGGGGARRSFFVQLAGQRRLGELPQLLAAASVAGTIGQAVAQLQLVLEQLLGEPLQLMARRLGRDIGDQQLVAAGAAGQHVLRTDEARQQIALVAFAEGEPRQRKGRAVALDVRALNLPGASRSSRGSRCGAGGG